MWPTLVFHLLPSEKHAKGTSFRHIIAYPCAEPSPFWFASRIRWHELPETASACRTDARNVVVGDRQPHDRVRVNVR
jgi:hypothetical protein